MTDQTSAYTYDTGANANGRLSGASDSNHSLSWSYDILGRVISKSQVVGGVSRSVGYNYTAGHMTSTTLPSGQVINYGYNASGQVTSVTLGTGSPVTVLNNVLYMPFGPVEGWTWGNGTQSSRTYDLDGRIANRVDALPVSYTLPSGVTNLTVAPGSNQITATIGATRMTFNLTSDCVNGLRGRVTYQRRRVRTCNYLGRYFAAATGHGYGFRFSCK